MGSKIQSGVLLCFKMFELFAILLILSLVSSLLCASDGWAKTIIIRLTVVGFALALQQVFVLRLLLIGWGLNGLVIWVPTINLYRNLVLVRETTGLGVNRLDLLNSLRILVEAMFFLHFWALSSRDRNRIAHSLNGNLGMPKMVLPVLIVFVVYLLAGTFDLITLGRFTLLTGLIPTVNLALARSKWFLAATVAFFSVSVVLGSLVAFILSPFVFVWYLLVLLSRVYLHNREMNAIQVILWERLQQMREDRVKAGDTVFPTPVGLAYPVPTLLRAQGFVNPDTMTDVEFAEARSSKRQALIIREAGYVQAQKTEDLDVNRTSSPPTEYSQD